MAKYCPIKNGPALYLECLECDDKVCENKQPKQINKEKSDDEH